MGKKIIIIDDSATVREHVRVVLSGAGYQTVEAGDGVAGIAAIRAHRDAALVLCDVFMPRLNGLDMLEEVMGGADRPGAPIVMLSTEGQAEAIARARRAGAKGWIVKPVQEELLIKTVAKILGPA